MSTRAATKSYDLVSTKFKDNSKEIFNNLLRWHSTQNELKHYLHQSSYISISNASIRCGK